MANKKKISKRTASVAAKPTRALSPPIIPPRPSLYRRIFALLFALAIFIGITVSTGALSRVGEFLVEEVFPGIFRDNHDQPHEASTMPRPSIRPGTEAKTPDVVDESRPKIKPEARMPSSSQEPKKERLGAEWLPGVLSTNAAQSQSPSLNIATIDSSAIEKQADDPTAAIQDDEVEKTTNSMKLESSSVEAQIFMTRMQSLDNSWSKLAGAISHLNRLKAPISCVELQQLSEQFPNSDDVFSDGPTRAEALAEVIFYADLSSNNCQAKLLADSHFIDVQRHVLNIGSVPQAPSVQLRRGMHARDLEARLNDLSLRIKDADLTYIDRAYYDDLTHLAIAVTALIDPDARRLVVDIPQEYTFDPIWRRRLQKRIADLAEALKPIGGSKLNKSSAQQAPLQF